MQKWLHKRITTRMARGELSRRCRTRWREDIGGTDIVGYQRSVRDAQAVLARIF